MKRVTIAIRAAIPAVALALSALAFAQEVPGTLSMAIPLERTSTDLTTSAGQTLAEACPKSLAMYPYAHPYAWPEARATLRLDQRATSTAVAIHLTGVRPHTRFSAWALPTAAAGGSARGTDDLVDLGSDTWSNARGHATLATRVPFPLVDGSERVRAGATFDLRVASHCADHAGRTVEPGPRQEWFHGRAAPAIMGAE